MNGGYVYLIAEWDRMEEDKNPVKIGFTRDSIENRMKELQTGNSSGLHVLSWFETKNPLRLEKMLHLHYFKSKINREWFLFSDRDVLDFKKICEYKEKVIELLKRENCYFS